MTIHEAFLAGIPVISSNIGGMAELVRDSIDGLHFEVGNSEDLYERIMTIIDNTPMLDKLRKNIGSMKSIEDNASEIEKMYSELMITNIMRHPQDSPDCYWRVH